MARFARIDCLRFSESLRIVFRATKNCESQVRGDSRESLEPYETVNGEIVL